MNALITLLVVVLFSFNPTHTISTITGNNTNQNTTQTFTVPFNSYVFHTPTQTLYCGLDQTSGTFSLASLATTNSVSFQGMAVAATNNSTSINGTFVNNLALLTPTTNGSNHYIVCTSTAGIGTLPTSVFAVNSGTHTVLTSGNLNDANGANTTYAVVSVEAGNNYIFTAVMDGTTPATSTQNFGTNAYDGISITLFSPTAQTLTPLVAQTGEAQTQTTENKALLLNNTITQVNGNIPGSPPTISTSYIPALCWCEELGTLYIGLQGTSINSGIMMGVVMAQVNPTTHALSYVNSLNTYTHVGTTSIIGTSGANTVCIQNMSIMKTSTGFFYLIINGGNGTQNATSNQVYAVPLVGAHGDVPGTFADITEATFLTQAGAANTLYTTSSPQAVVGCGTFPGSVIAIANPPVQGTANSGISSLFVEGDTVFISTYAQTPNANNAPAVYYSQAIFNQNGQIQTWTNWAKAAPFESGNSTTNGSSAFVVVNALTGQVFTSNYDFDAESGNTINATTWISADTVNQNALINKLKSTLTEGCFSVLDLNQSVLNLGNTTVDRYALFGGAGKISFAKISVAAAVGYEQPETVITDFSQATNFVTTTLPNDTDPVTCLGYSGWTANEGYFFAGTKNGLYVYANTTGLAPFAPGDLGDLNAAPFDTDHAWQKITDVTGEVRAIRTVGGSSAVYVLTKNIVNGNPLDTIYQIPVGQNLGTINTIAVSSADSLTAAQLFFDIAIVPLNSVITSCYGVLATSNGLYTSSVNIDQHASDAQAGWTLSTTPVPTVFYSSFKQPFTQYPLTFYSSSWSDTLGKKTYSDGLLHQYGSPNNSTAFTETTPSFVTNATTPPTIQTVTSLLTDGTRRFMIMQPSDGDGSSNKLYILPYQTDSSHWNYSGTPLLITDSVFDNVKRYYWVSTLGATGRIYVSTDQGIKVLG